MSTNVAMSDPLAEWPTGEPVGLLIFAEDSSSRLSDPNAMSLVMNTARRWWSASAKNMAVGPTVDPPFRNLYFVELDEPSVAASFVDELRETEPASTTIVAASPISPKSWRRLTRFQSFMRRLPNPSRTGGSLPPAYQGSLIPNDAQMRRLQTLQQDEPVLVLSLNRYRDRAVDPLTGQEMTGREVFQPYFRRTLSTFSRLGARIVWMGHARGVVTGALDMPVWHHIMAVSYPSYDAVSRMIENPGLQSKARYRIAALDASWIVTGQLVASSEG